MRHPQTQGKIERRHQTLKNRILLEHAYLPGDPEARIEDFVTHSNYARAHESLNNLTPDNVSYGRGEAIGLFQPRYTLSLREIMPPAVPALDNFPIWSSAPRPCARFYLP